MSFAAKPRPFVSPRFLPREEVLDQIELLFKLPCTSTPRIKQIAVLQLCEAIKQSLHTAMQQEEFFMSITPGIDGPIDQMRNDTLQFLGLWSFRKG